MILYTKSNSLTALRRDDFVTQAFKTVDEILGYYHSNETLLADFLHGAFYFFIFYQKELFVTFPSGLS